VKLLLMRHGIAVDRMDPACPPDEERPLTPKGERRTRAAARGLAALGIEIEAALSSPLVRARETAEIAAEVLGLDPADVELTALLRPGSDPAALVHALEKRSESEILCVGHAPHLDLVIAACLGIRGEPPLALKKAGVALIDVEPQSGRGHLEWLLEPRALRKLGA
jgi:phosphohistidine phosphatase